MFKCVCVCAPVCTSMCLHMSASALGSQKNSRYPGAGVAGGWELTDKGSGNQTWILCGAGNALNQETPCPILSSGNILIFLNSNVI